MGIENRYGIKGHNHMYTYIRKCLQENWDNSNVHLRIYKYPGVLYHHEYSNVSQSYTCMLVAKWAARQGIVQCGWKSELAFVRIY